LKADANSGVLLFGGLKVLLMISHYKYEEEGKTEDQKSELALKKLACRVGLLGVIFLILEHEPYDLEGNLPHLDQVLPSHMGGILTYQTK